MKKCFLGILMILAGFYLPKPAVIFLPHSQIIGLAIVLVAMVLVFGGAVVVLHGLFFIKRFRFTRQLYFWEKYRTR